MKSILACLFLATAASASITDGEFKKGIRGWVLINNSGSAELSHDKKRKALRFDKQRAGGMDVARYDLNEIPAPGSEFVLKARFEAKGVGNGWFKVFFYDKNGADLGQGRDVKPLRGTYKFKEISLDLKVPDNAARATIFILLMMPGTLLVDDVALDVKGGAGGARAGLTDKKLVAWLDKNAIPVRTLSTGDHMRDLAPLAKHLRGVRIVQLGENTHGDALAFAAKCRLVRWLHERMGFDVLAFESGMFECERANRLIRPDGDAKKVMRASIFPIWHTERTVPVFKYLIEQSATRKPMRLSGFDLQESGGDAKHLIADATAMLAAIDVAVKEGAGAQSALGLLRKNEAQLLEKHGKGSVLFMERALEDRVLFAEQKDLKGKAALNFRDARMAANLGWLATVRYPKSKIVCWAATAHQAHGLQTVLKGDEKLYAGLTMMGEHVHKQFGAKCFTLGFIAHGGWAGAWHRPNFAVPKPQEGSMEDFLHRYGKPRLIVPLRGRTPFTWPMYMAPMTYVRTLNAPWPKVLDAVFFIDEMEPTSQMR
ncbi:MAG: erythromycin esterase family protein [Planctomycetota bacterium]|jgi:erythromycin esterase